MTASSVTITYIGGPTALVEWGAFRLLTDPTFDPAGESYPTPAYTLRKTMSPAIAVDDIGRVDAVLLSHDHHFDNLDRAGRAMLGRAGTVLTTVAGAERLAGNVVGLAQWSRHELKAPDGSVLRVTAMPARHGPENGDRGPVIGFVLEIESGSAAVYFSGDTVWFDGVLDVSRRFQVRVALLNAGAARVKVAGHADLTFPASQMVDVARAFRSAVIVPLHYEGWEHFTETRADVERAFEEAGMTERLRWPRAGAPTTISLEGAPG